MGAPARLWTVSAGGGDTSSTNFFVQRWRRIHKYDPPSLPTSRNYNPYELARSQLPPDYPNFVVLSLNALTAQRGTLCLERSGMAGQNGCGITSQDASLLVSDLEQAAIQAASLSPEILAQIFRRMRKKKSKAEIMEDAVLEANLRAPAGIQLTYLELPGLRAIVIEVVPVLPNLNPNPKWWGHQPLLTAQETQAAAFHLAIAHNLESDDAQFASILQATAAELDTFPLADVVPTLDTRHERTPFAVQVPENTPEGGALLVQPPSPSAPPFAVQVPPGGRPGQTIFIYPPTAETGVPTTAILLDTDEDGKVDTLGVHTLGQDRPDRFSNAILLDTNGDGVLDSVQYDSTADGVPNAVAKI